MIFFHTLIVVIAVLPSALTHLTKATRRSCLRCSSAKSVLMGLPCFWQNKCRASLWIIHALRVQFINNHLSRFFPRDCFDRAVPVKMAIDGMIEPPNAISPERPPHGLTAKGRFSMYGGSAFGVLSISARE